MDDELRKELLRKALKEKNKGKKYMVCRYQQKFPDSAEREYIRIINSYMAAEKEILIKYIPLLKQILNEASQFHTDSKKDNENRRKKSRLSVIDNIIVKLTVLFKSIEKEVEAAAGLFDLKRKIDNIANLGQKLTTLEWKKAVRKALGINLLDDYYSGDIYKDLLEKWVSDNVDLIKTAQSNSLDKMKEIVYQNYMKGTTTTDIVKEIQRQYGMTKRHTKLIARDQMGKLNSKISQYKQQDAGIEEYIWSTAGDERVRNSHRELNGKKFRWDSPPLNSDGRRCHPGEDYQCRCIALAVIDIDTVDLPV